MARKPKAQAAPDGLFAPGAPTRSEAPPPPAPTAISTPAVVEFKVGLELWRCGRFDLLAVEMTSPDRRFGETDLPPLVELALLPDLARSWLICRRLFGLVPVIPRTDTDPDDLRLWSHEELQAALGITRNHLQRELEALRGTWLARFQARDRRPEIGEKAPVSSLPSPVTPDGQLNLPPAPDPLAVLKKFGLTDFDLRDGEKEWFPARVEDYGKVLEQKHGYRLGRSMLFNELLMARCEKEILQQTDFKTGEAVRKQRAQLQEEFQKQLDQLQALFPWASAIAGGVALKSQLSELTRGYQEYYAKGTNQIFDGIFTATEVRVELRRSVQNADPRYRAGLVLYLNHCKAHLWDKNFTPQFKPAELRALDEGFKAAVVAAQEREGVELPDLESDDPVAGEYEDLAMEVKK